MEWNENFATEYRRCQNGMEDNLPYLHTNSTPDFDHGIYRKIYTDDNKKYMETFSKLIICRQISRQIRS